MKCTLKKGIALALVVSFTCMGTMPAAASTINDLTNKQNQINQEMKNTQNKLKETKEEKKSAVQQLEEINNSIARTTDEIEKLENKIIEAQKKIEEAIKRINLKQGEVDERTDIFGTRLKEMYQYGDVSFLEVLFESSSLSDFLTRFEYLRYIADNDAKLLEELEIARAELEEQKAELETKKAELVSLKGAQEEKKSQLQIASAEQQKVVKQIEQEESSYQQMLNELESESQKLAAELKKLQSSGGTKPGSLVWPTPGYHRVTSPYGSRVHPVTGVRSFHTGVDLAAPKGANAVSAASGTVIFTGWRGAYGNTVLVDHGGGMVTMYPHLSKIVVSNGAKVSAGQVVGKVGSTGMSTGPHLHFEVRINGDHVSPNKYIGL